MHLNIKSDKAHELAAELAKLTGESMSAAVTEAIRQRLQHERQRRDQQRLAADLLAIGRRSAARERRDQRSHGEFLYDDRGLPR